MRLPAILTSLRRRDPGPARHCPAHGLDLYGTERCGYCLTEAGQVIETVNDRRITAALERQAQGAELFTFGIDDDPDPVWLAAQPTALLTVCGTDGKVAGAIRVPAFYAVHVATQANALGLTASITGRRGVNHVAAWGSMYWQLADDERDDANDEANAHTRTLYGTDDLEDLDADGQYAWCKAACEALPAWMEATK